MQLTSFILGLGVGLLSARVMSRPGRVMSVGAGSSGHDVPASGAGDASESPNAGERLQQNHLAGANAGIGQSLPGGGNDARLFPGQSKVDDEDAEEITPGLPDFARGA